MKGLQVLVLAVCIFGTLGVSLFTQNFDEEWNAWKAEHGKSYPTEKEEVMRRMTWQQNLEMIVKHNLEHQRGLHTYRLGMNEFGDMAHDEFLTFFNGLKLSDSKSGSTFLPPSNVQIPKSVDWRTKGYVTGVKNQMQCGSCWAFSATGSLEGQHFKSTGNLVSLSEQNLVDCSRPEGNMGCEGGLMDQAFEYVIKNGGIDTEASYPYTAMDEPTCKFTKANIGATCTGYTDIPTGNEKALTEAIATVGPISVAIDASHDSFQFYESGVYNEPACSSTILDHGVLAVGYDTTQSGTDYYIVKNSWGTSWGMKGYIWMSRNKDNQCGIATSSSYPLV